MKTTKRVRKTISGTWSRTVWFGHPNNPTNVMRYEYATRKEARAGDISDSIGKNGRVS